MSRLHSFKRVRQLVAAAFREQVQSERAYPGNLASDILSTGFYMVTFIVFLELLFQRTGAIAGFSKNDFLLLFLIGQASHYVIYSGIFTPMVRLIESVRNGNFDLLLLKPVPTRTFFYVSSVKPITTFLSTVPNLILLSAIINWSEIHLSWFSFAAGSLIWCVGLILYNTLLFTLTLPVFKVGEATDILNTFYNFDSIREMPYSKLPTIMKGLSLILLPSLLMTAGTVDVMLMKSDPTPIVLSAVAAGVVSLWLQRRLWRWALRHYTSASS